MTDFLSDADVRAFREPVARLVSAVAAPDQLWIRLAEDLGVLGIPVPAEYGGLGLTLGHLAVVNEELGRQLSPVPFLASAGAATALLLELATPEQRAEVLPALVEGKSIATVALAGSCSARRGAGGYHLTGVKDFVLHGLTADLLVVRAQLDGDERYFLVQAEQADREPLSGLDPSRPLARITLADTSAQLLGVATAGPTAGADRGLAAAKVLLSAESVGAAAECLRMTVDYLKVRRQFGQPIGSFQAVQHRAADLLGELESARAVVEAAAGVTGAELVALAPVARARSADAFALIARETIQLHGGIGFTWEHPAHRYFKRSLVDLQLLGHPADQRQEVAARLAG